MRAYDRSRRIPHPKILKPREEIEQRIKEYHKIWYLKNKDRVLIRQREYRARNIEYYRKYDQEWTQKNRYRKILSTYKRRRNLDDSKLSEFQRTMIRCIYKEAQEKRERTNGKYHVDHIIPLSKGGLHVPNNLRIITAEENLRKSHNIPHGTQLPLMF
jgi:5-methylcytosine-specific restriction endonuclease McrA